MNDCAKRINSISFIKELKAGKESAFDFLFRSRYKELCHFAWSFIGDYHLSEDIVQELFSTIWKKKTAINENQSLDSYLYVSVRNACYTHLKSNKQNVSIDVLMQQVIQPETELCFNDPGLNKLWNTVETLPLQCKIIFKLVVLEELKYKEVAERLDVTVNTVKTQMKIAYKILRKQIAKEEVLVLLYLSKRTFNLGKLFTNRPYVDRKAEKSTMWYRYALAC